MSGRKSRNKGKNGEREFANFLKDNGINARRGVQYKGTSDSPDVEGLDGFHVEVKRCESLHLYPSLEQAISDSNGNVPIVAHRKNRKEWVVILRATDFINLLKRETRCPECGTLMIYTESDDLVCPYCGLTK